MGALTAFLDTNILYSAGLRDFLLRLAERHLYSPLWSACIHTEWMRNLVANRPDLTADDQAVVDRLVQERGAGGQCIGLHVNAQGRPPQTVPHFG